ncbi:MAG: phosphoribosylanthranilate isomerase [Calditrichaeota bacterium]|nr:MAG: phosphoribosylanthranilate isomerase [Calditrichota bacterium]
MDRLFVKICGITRLVDALTAYRYGADMLGFIFYKKSKRYITPKNAGQILDAIAPMISRVGVFVNEDVEKIIRISQKLNLDYVQLSGDERKSDVRRIRNTGFKVIKTFHITTGFNKKSLINHPADIIHLDTADKKLYGGVGKSFDWNIKIPKTKNLMLAGGLNENNVLKGIKTFQPLIVDLNSGVEIKPGYKSKTKLERIFLKLNRYRYGKKTR